MSATPNQRQTTGAPSSPRRNHTRSQTINDTPRRGVVSEDATRLIRALHCSKGWAYYWQAGKGSTWFRAGEVPEQPAASDVYFGVNLVAQQGARNQRGRLKTITALGCLFAEFDAKDFGGDKAAALAHILALPIRPSAIVDSGGGYHCYWFLAEPWLLTSETERERASSLQARWVEYVGGDPNAKDLARVLRVPGTLNTKYDPPRPIELLYLHDECRYPVAELEALAPAAAPIPIVSAVPQRAAQERVRGGRVSASEVIARFNAEHCVEQLIRQYGGHVAGNLVYCNCGVAHGPGRNQGALTSEGKVAFYTSRCGWSPRSGRQVADAFDLFAQVEHGGDKTAALRAYNPIAPQSQASEEEAAARRARDAERKRNARRAGPAATLQAVLDRAAEDEQLRGYPTAAAVLRELLDIADGRPWCSPSKAALAERLKGENGKPPSERTVQRALAWLEGRYISTEEHTSDTGARWRGGHHTTPRRTFLREALQSIPMPQSSERGETSQTAKRGDMSPEHINTERVRGGGGRAAQPPSAPTGQIAPEPNSLDEADWVGLLSLQAPPPEELADPGAVAAWEVSDGLCSVPVEVLPLAEAAAATEALAVEEDALRVIVHRRLIPQPIVARPAEPEAVSFPGGASFAPTATVPLGPVLSNWGALCAHWERIALQQPPDHNQATASEQLGLDANDPVILPLPVVIDGWRLAPPSPAPAAAQGRSKGEVDLIAPTILRPLTLIDDIRKPDGRAWHSNEELQMEQQTTTPLSETQRWALNLADDSGWGVVAEGKTTAVELRSGNPRRGLVFYLHGADQQLDPDPATLHASVGTTGPTRREDRRPAAAPSTSTSTAA